MPISQCRVHRDDSINHTINLQVFSISEVLIFEYSNSVLGRSVCGSNITSQKLYSFLLIDFLTSFKGKLTSESCTDTVNSCNQLLYHLHQSLRQFKVYNKQTRGFSNFYEISNLIAKNRSWIPGKYSQMKNQLCNSSIVLSKKIWRALLDISILLSRKHCSKQGNFELKRGQKLSMQQ